MKKSHIFLVVFVCLLGYYQIKKELFLLLLRFMSLILDLSPEATRGFLYKTFLLEILQYFHRKTSVLGVLTQT